MWAKFVNNNKPKQTTNVMVKYTVDSKKAVNVF